MRLLTIVSIIILLSGALFAGESYLVKIKSPVLSKLLSSDNNSVICIEEQCYILTETVEQAKTLIDEGIGIWYEPNIVHNPAAGVQPEEHTPSDNQSRGTKCVY